MRVGRFPSFSSYFLLSVSDVESQYYYIKTPYSFRDLTTPPKSAVTDKKSGKIQMLNFGNALKNYITCKKFRTLKFRTFYFERLIFGHFSLISDNFRTNISDTALRHALSKFTT